MKKETLRNYKNLTWIVGLVLVVILVALVIRNFTGQVIGDINPENIEDPLGIGLNPDNIPQTPEDASSKVQAKWDYLKKEWTNIIANNKVVGPIHEWCLNHPLVFKILFNYPYQMSTMFLLIFLMWLYDLIVVANFFEQEKLFGFGGSLFPGLIIGLGSTILFSHIRFYEGVARLIMKIFNFASSAWWKELLVWVFLIILGVIIFSAEKFLEKYLKTRSEEKEKEEMKHETKKSREFIEGVEEGREMTKDIRKMKKDVFEAGGGI
jgi:hypothetical protein